LSIQELLNRDSSKRPRPLACAGKKENDYLTIDCSKCDGPQDLGQLRCLRGCVRAIAEAGNVEHIALARDVVIEYGGRGVTALQRMASPIVGGRPARRSSSTRCSKCPIEPSKLIDQLYENWPPMPPPSCFEVPFHQGRGVQCASCRNRTLATMESAKRELSVLNLQLNQLAVRVLGGSR
jgi:hypothetical protein